MIYYCLLTFIYGMTVLKLPRICLFRCENGDQVMNCHCLYKFTESALCDLIGKEGEKTPAVMLGVILAQVLYFTA